jgi:hypothetical protein
LRDGRGATVDAEDKISMARFDERLKVVEADIRAIKKGVAFIVTTIITTIILALLGLVLRTSA